MKSPTIFVAEDDKSLNNLIQRSLQREGFITDGAINGSEALRKLSRHDDFLLVLDYKLPDITGKELIQALEEKNCQAPFIVVTGHGDEGIAVEMMKQGARDYIVKSSDFTKIIPHVVRNVVNDLKQEQELANAEIELREREADLSMLYKIFTSMSQTMEIEKLLSIILETITDLKIFGIKRKGGIFLVKEDRMELAAHLGHDKAFLDLHKSLRVGNCLCGLSAKTGKVIISQNCYSDDRHNISYPGMAAHGHVILPLTARGKTIGVLYLYTPQDSEINESKLKLLHTIGNQIGIAIDHAKLYEKAKRFALHDPLTGLANRRLMHIVFERTINRSKRFNQSFAVIMLDIDHFKEFNDTYGHSAGDRLLARLAHLIKKETRNIDLAVRYGGEEFLILLPETNLEKAREIAERIRVDIEKNINITISLGIALGRKDVKNEEDIIRKADCALYKAKETGRNRVAVYTK